MNYKEIKGTIKTLSPLHHGSDENLGIDRTLHRIEIIIDGKSENIPILSGNSIRGKIRRLIMQDFLELLEIPFNSITDKLYYMLFVGGSLEKGSNQRYFDVDNILEFRSNIPAISLLGTAYGSGIMKGKLNVGYAYPICKETINLTEQESNKSYYEYLDWDYGTRNDDYEGNNITKKDSDGAVQMLYRTEIFKPNTEFNHQYRLIDCNEIEESCFSRMINLLKIAKTLGAKSSVGFGKCEFDYELKNIESDNKYIEYIGKNKNKIKEYVLSLNNQKTIKKVSKKDENED